MASASIPPSNIALLAVLGVGAYWFATRTAQGATLANGAASFLRPAATPIGPVAQTYQANDNALWNSVGKILGKVIDTGWQTPGINGSSNPYYQANKANSGPSGPVYGESAGDPYSGLNDSYAANLAPGYSSIYDYSQEYWM